MTKQSTLWMGVAATALLVAAQYFSVRSRPWRPGMGPAHVGAWGWLMFCSVAVAIVGSLWLTHRIIQWLSTRSLIGARRSAATSVTAYILAAVSFPFALFLGVTIGGNLGGGWGDWLIGRIGAPIGIGIGLFGVTMLIAGPAAVVGFLLGGLIARLLSHRT